MSTIKGLKQLVLCMDSKRIPSHLHPSMVYPLSPANMRTKYFYIPLLLKHVTFPSYSFLWFSSKVYQRSPPECHSIWGSSVCLLGICLILTAATIQYQLRRACYLAFLIIIGRQSYCDLLLNTCVTDTWARFYSLLKHGNFVKLHLAVCLLYTPLGSRTWIFFCLKYLSFHFPLPPSALPSDVSCLLVE